MPYLTLSGLDYLTLQKLIFILTATELLEWLKTETILVIKHVASVTSIHSFAFIQILYTVSGRGYTIKKEDSTAQSLCSV